ncbi:hypothetical protein [Streptomyces lydicus]|uniref:hypothetical protein n=1 Tax=Streptomyces lydicus TaxID=47763 RepID=UPI0036F0408F
MDTRHYRLVTEPERPDYPIGIDLNVRILRKRLLRAATPSQLEAALQGLRGLLGLDD